MLIVDTIALQIVMTTESHQLTLGDARFRLFRRQTCRLRPAGRIACDPAVSLTAPMEPPLAGPRSTPVTSVSFQTHPGRMLPHGWRDAATPCPPLSPTGPLGFPESSGFPWGQTGPCRIPWPPLSRSSSFASGRIRLGQTLLFPIFLPLGHRSDRVGRKTSRAEEEKTGEPDPRWSPPRRPCRGLDLFWPDWSSRVSRGRVPGLADTPESHARVVRTDPLWKRPRDIDKRDFIPGLANERSGGRSGQTGHRLVERSSPFCPGTFPAKPVLF